MKAALEAFHAGQHDVLTKFVANYEGKSLDLSSKNLGQVGASAVAKGLQMNTSLRELDMQSNNIGAEGARAFGEALKVNKTLVKFDVGNNEIGPAGAEAMANMLKVNQTLTTIDLWNNKIGDEGAAHIAAAVKVNASLTEISLWGNGIGDAGAIAIGRALEENKECKLEKLDISRNQIGAEGAQHIAKALEVNKTLQTLNINWNSIGAQGAEHIAEALKDHPSVTSVDLRVNSLSVESGSALAAVAKQNPRIKKMCGIPLDSLRDNKTTELKLSSTSLGPAEAAILAEFLKVNGTLQHIDLRNNQLGDEGAKHIASALKVNSSIRSIDLRANNIGIEGAKAIGLALQVNPILEKLSGVELKNHIQGLPQGVSDNERILEYLRKQSKIKETTATKKNEEKTKVLSSAQQEARAMLQEPAVQERLKKLKEEKTRPRSYHAFLSHMQTQAAKDCMLLHKQLPLEHGLSVWYDNAESTRRLDTVGMMEAVAHSVCLLVIATRDYFSRKWCLFEVECAQELDVPIVVVLQTQGEYALSFESLLAAQPSWCNHEILRTPDQNKLWDSWVRVTLATRLEEEMEAAKKKGVPVPERKKAGSDGGASLNQAHLDALKAVDLDLDTLAVTSREELEEIFKELSVAEMKCAFAAATPQVLQGLLFNDWTCSNQSGSNYHATLNFETNHGCDMPVGFRFIKTMRQDCC
eukprot:g54964.t1